mmetsp:Transcript_21966/g.51698  ORF Transcript_21966/g.51698 Transcript_21966/m.51698 type:complete len:1242 (-) Transcript_21966:63-3788(-)
MTTKEASIDRTTNNDETSTMTDLVDTHMMQRPQESRLLQDELPTDGEEQEEQEEEEVCYGMETLETEYQSDKFVQPCNGLMFYYSAREKPLRLSAMEIDVRDDLSNDLTVQIYTTLEDTTGDNAFEKGGFKDPTYWTKIAETELIQHPDPALSHRYLVPAYAFTKVFLEPKQRNAMYVRTTRGALLDYTTNPFIKEHGEVVDIGSNLHIHSGYCLPEGNGGWVYQLDQSRITNFAGKFYEDVESSFCDFVPTTETSLEFVWVLDTNGEGLEFSKFEEELQVFAQDTILDDVRLVDYTAQHELKISPKKRARVFFRRYEDCPSEWSFCEALVAKVFYEHLETLTASQLKAQIYKHEPWLKDQLLEYLPLDQRIYPAGLVDDQAKFTIRLQNVPPLANMDDVQINFFQTELLQFFKDQLPSDKAVVMDMEVTGQDYIEADAGGRFLRGTQSRSLQALGNQNQLILSGHFEGVRTGIETSSDFANRIDGALQWNQTEFLNDLKFNMGLPGNGMDENERHWLFYDVIDIQTVSDADDFSIPIEWVPGRARVEEPTTDDSGDEGRSIPPYTLYVVLALVGLGLGGVAVYFLLKCCVKWHLRKLTNQIEEREKTLSDEPKDLVMKRSVEEKMNPYLVEEASDSEAGTKIFEQSPRSTDETCDNVSAENTDPPQSPAGWSLPGRMKPNNILTPMESMRSMQVDSPGNPQSPQSADPSCSSEFEDEQEALKSESPRSTASTFRDPSYVPPLSRQNSREDLLVFPGARSLSRQNSREETSIFPGARNAKPNTSRDDPNWEEMVRELRKEHSEPDLVKDPGSPCSKPSYKLLYLRQMSGGQLKRLLVDHHIQFDPRQVVEKDDLIRILVLSEKVEVTSDIPGYVQRRFSQRGGLFEDEEEEDEPPSSAAEEVSIADMAAHLNHSRVRSNSFDTTTRKYTAPSSRVVNHNMTAGTARRLPQRTKSADFPTNRRHTTENNNDDRDHEESSPSGGSKSSHKRGGSRKKPTRTKSSDDMMGTKSKSKHSDSSPSSKSSSSGGRKHRKAPVRTNSADDLRNVELSDLWEDEPEDTRSEKKKKSSSSDDFERKKVKRSHSYDATSSSRSRSKSHHHKRDDRSVDRKTPQRSHSSDAVHDKKKKSHKSSKRRSRSRSSEGRRRHHRSRSRSTESHRSTDSTSSKRRHHHHHRHHKSGNSSTKNPDDTTTEKDMLLKMAESLNASATTFASTTSALTGDNDDDGSDSDNSFENEIFGDL